MICSTIIPTIGRYTLSRAVESVLQQDFDANEFEVIIVNDSGQPLPHADWMDSAQVTVLHTNRLNRSIARNTGAAVARGHYLHFLDDDDWMLPNAFQHLWRQSKIAPQAGWVYGGFQLVDNEGTLMKEIHPRETGNCFIHLLASEWIPIQASWVNTRVFSAVGGFAHLNTLEGGYEDIDLTRMVAQQSDFATAPEAVAVIRYGDVGSTTDYNNSLRQNRRSREKSLDINSAFGRLLTSAKADKTGTHYWHGQIIYYYLVSLVLNVKQRKPIKALSRLMFAILAFLVSIPHVLSRDFWRGALRPHHNLVRVALSELEKKLYRRTVWKN